MPLGHHECATGALTTDFSHVSRQINLETLLRESNAGYVRVPHRANRIVIFNSTLVHETDSFTFRTGYNNRRINFTFLFGARKWVRGPATVRTSEAA